MACPICASEDIQPAIFVKNGYELARCRNCEVAFVANPPTASELERYYSFASGYHVGFRDNDDAVARRLALAEEQLAAIVRHKKPGRCLDIGASAGFFVKVASDRGWEARGIELSRDTAALARQRFGVDVANARLEDTEFESASFDAVTLWDVIEHVPDPLDTMCRVAKLLRPGGVVGLITPNLDGLFSRSSYRVARRINHWPAVAPPAHLFQFSTNSLTALLERVGLRIVELDYRRIPFGYAFGSPRELRKPRVAAYAAVFAPLMLAGPLVHAGDELLVIAKAGA
jgi:2-polyprenyl-3-methyl-5-hydroxy-6-metoxy-1,4-benzoquinol methylase